MSIVNEWPMVKLGDLGRFISGGTPNRKRPEFYEGSIPWISSADLSDTGKISTRRSITEEAIASSATKLVPAHTILIATRIGVGKVAITSEEMCFSQDIVALVDIDEAIVSSSFLKHMILIARPYLQGIARGVTIKGISTSDLQRLELPLPPLDEQQRIAEMLNFSQQQLHLLETKRADLDSLKTESVDQVLDLNDRKTLPLKEIVEIQSGITKGRKVREGETLTETPYMAVSNVKDGYLDLQNVKTLPVTEAETTRFSLQAGDILLTEGGDPDKLGRGTVWREEIETCLHQNHIFRVRLPEDSQFTPEVLMAMLATKQARAYFFRSAKQTTGIASINKTQLSAVPVPVLTSEEIAKLSKLLNQVDAITEDLEKRQESSEELHNSLSTRAFAGQL